MRLPAEAEAQAALTEAEDAGTRKGRSFEERVHEAIERIAAARGEERIMLATSEARGSKKGDTVVEIGACDGPAVGRMVFESKDEQLSKNRAWEELNGAMTERDARLPCLRSRERKRSPQAASSSWSTKATR